jgi:hypothetical protein
VGQPIDFNSHRRLHSDLILAIRLQEAPPGAFCLAEILYK